MGSKEDCYLVYVNICMICDVNIPVDVPPPLCPWMKSFPLSKLLFTDICIAKREIPSVSKYAGFTRSSQTI